MTEETTFDAVVHGDGILSISLTEDNNVANETGQPFDGNLSTSETLQAQHSRTNDSPTDVNINAVIAREQTEMFSSHGLAMTHNSDRRTKMADHFASLLQAKSGGTLS